MTITTDQGDGGKWRWKVTSGETDEGMSSIQGYSTKAEAEEAAKRVFEGQIYLETEAGRVLSASAREFS